MHHMISVRSVFVLMLLKVSAFLARITCFVTMHIARFLFFCLCVGLTGEPCRNGWTSQDAIWGRGQTRMGLVNLPLLNAQWSIRNANVILMSLVWLSSPLVALRYVMYFWFMDDIMFAHNGQDYATWKGSIIKAIQQGSARSWHCSEYSNIGGLVEFLLVLISQHYCCVLTG